MPSNEVAPDAFWIAVLLAAMPDSPGPDDPGLACADRLRLATGVRSVSASGPTAGATSGPVPVRLRCVVCPPCTTRVVTVARELLPPDALATVVVARVAAVDVTMAAAATAARVLLTRMNNTPRERQRHRCCCSAADRNPE